MLPQETITAFDSFLAERGESFEAVIIGSTALALLGILNRHTKDCNVLDPEIPGHIQRSAREFAEEQRQAGVPIADDWLNNGPDTLKRDLDEGWRERLQLAFAGKAMKLHTLGRLDLLASKLYALCDRGTDLGDCLAMEPTREEIEQVRPWVEERDGNPLWPEHVRRTLEDLMQRSGDGLQ